MKLWILTEERPKKNVLGLIIKRFAADNELKIKANELKIIPKIKNGIFSFVYQVIGVSIDSIEEILLKVISGSSSFVDFLIFMQEQEPDKSSKPLYAIEETKTSDKESRNTGVYQRCSKFVFVDLYYPSAKKIMLYNIQTENESKPTSTNIFGTRMLMTIGVEILGKKLDPSIFKPFKSVDELIDLKNKMRGAPRGNVPILFTKKNNCIEVSGRLIKSGTLSHDPNIGALSIIGKTLRKLNWSGDIVITKHGLSQKHVSNRNKFVIIANNLKMKLLGLTLPTGILPGEYWTYNTTSEKMAGIFLHIVLEETKGISVIYENHAGCERGYFKTSNGTCLAIHKYIENKKNKGDLRIPDIIVRDDNNKEILILEAKKTIKMSDGISELKGYGDIEKEYINNYYPDYITSSYVILFGAEPINHPPEVVFVLTTEGAIITYDTTPKTISDALKNVRQQRIKLITERLL